MGKVWGLIRRGRENLEGRITRNCAEGGNSAPQAWLVVPGVGEEMGGIRAGVFGWDLEEPGLWSYPATNSLLTFPLAVSSRPSPLVKQMLDEQATSS